MAEEIKGKINKCLHCGSILSNSQRMSKIFNDADEALDRYYNKLREKKYDASK